MVDYNTNEIIPELRVLNELPTDGISCLKYLPPSTTNKIQQQQSSSSSSSSSSNELLLVSTSWDGHVRIHNTTSRSCVFKHNMNSGPLLSLTIPTTMTTTSNASSSQQQQQQPSSSSSSSSSPMSLVTGGCDGTIRKLDIETSKDTLIGKHSSNDDPNISISCSCLSSIDENIIVSAGWHKQLHLWDTRITSKDPIKTISLPGKAFSMDIDPQSRDLIVVATSGRRTCFIDIRNDTSDPTMNKYDANLILDRESSLKYQTRCIRFFPDGNSIALGSIEGRAAVEYLDDIDSKRYSPGQKFAFKCHRINDMVYPVNAIECHPLYGTFATGGCDGTVVLWDAMNKKKITSLPTFPTAISAMAFNSDGTELAIASSYTYEEGEREHPKDEIYVRSLLKSECSPKMKA